MARFIFVTGGVISSYEDSGEESDGEVQEVAKEVAALEEAKRVFKNWKRFEVDWLTMYPELAVKKKTNAELDLIEDLMNLDNGGALHSH